MTHKSLLRDNQKIVFLGDSITAAGNGYMQMTDAMIGALLPEFDITCINSGVGGHKVTDMLARVEETVIAHKPDWVTISVGINDVWHGENGVPIRQFQGLYDDLVSKLQRETKAQLALFTTTVIGEDLENENNRKLVAYNRHIRKTARERGLLLVDMNRAFHRAIAEWHKSGTNLRFTTDGVHMTPTGNYLMAHTLAKAWRML